VIITVALVREDPDLFLTFRVATPEQELGKLPIRRVAQQNVIQMAVIESLRCDSLDILHGRRLRIGIAILVRLMKAVESVIKSER